MKIAQQPTCRQQRNYGVSQREHRPLVNPQRDEERVDCERDYQRQRQDHDRPTAVLHALEPRRERVEHKQVRQQLWLDDRSGVEPRTGKRFPTRLPNEYRDEREAVHGEQDAQDRAEVA